MFMVLSSWPLASEPVQKWDGSPPPPFPSPPISLPFLSPSPPLPFHPLPLEVGPLKSS